MTTPKPPNEIDVLKDRKKPLRVVGIDLGTTNSTIAEVLWEPGEAAPKVRCVEVEQSTLEGTYTHVLFPSVVAIHEGRIWGGGAFLDYQGGKEEGGGQPPPLRKRETSTRGGSRQDAAPTTRTVASLEGG